MIILSSIKLRTLISTPKLLGPSPEAVGLDLGFIVPRIGGNHFSIDIGLAADRILGSTVTATSTYETSYYITATG